MEQAPLPRDAGAAAAVRPPEGHPVRRAVVVSRGRPPAARPRGRRRVPRRPGVLPLARGAQVPCPGAGLPGPVPRLPDLPRLRRRPAAPRGPAGAPRGPLDPGPRRAVGRRRSAVPGRARLLAGGGEGGEPRARRGRSAAVLPRGRGPRLPEPRPRVGLAFRRRVAAHRPGRRSRDGPRRHPVRPRRAVRRPAPAGHGPADRDPQGPARPGQHRGGGGARHRDRLRRRPRDRPRAGSGGPGRPGRLPGTDRVAGRGPAEPHRQVPPRGPAHPGPGRAGAGATACSCTFAAPRCTT